MTLLSVLSVLTTYHLRNTHYWYYCLSSNPPYPCIQYLHKEHTCLNEQLHIMTRCAAWLAVGGVVVSCMEDEN